MSTIHSNVIPMTASKDDNSTSLRDTFRESLAKYLSELEGDRPDNLYDMVLQQIEEPLLEMVMGYVDGNQSKAAQCLGLNRGTLRKKLKTYDLI